MIRVDLNEPDDEEWGELKSQLAEATSTLVDAAKKGERPEVTQLYADARLKQELRNPNGSFFGKCAYCESRVDANQPGDVEHFRPKGRVTDRDRKPIPDHPGYFWLSNDLDNLLLACADCNRPSGRKTEGKVIGKWDYFPVVGARAFRPGEEDREQPLLINPRFEDPEDHLEVTEQGIMVGRTERGWECIAVFGLNSRVSLARDRLQAFEDARARTKLAIIEAIMTEDDSGVTAVLQPARQGSLPYSMSARAGQKAAQEWVLRVVNSRQAKR